ncbi:MAG: helix-turn-helix transcriptional regulator [bacterium]|nr:helix-turn-helix transcriptional regulator [bacterium]
MEQTAIMVGLRIQSIRKQLGETMETFGKRFNVGKGTVNNWEKGRSIPKKPTLLLISKIGKLSVDELLFGSKSEYIEYLFKQKEHEVISDYDFISKEQLHNVVQDKKEKMLSKDLSEWDYNRIKKFIDRFFDKLVKGIPINTDDMLLEIVSTLNDKIVWVRGLYNEKGLKKKHRIQNYNLAPSYYQKVLTILQNARSEIDILRDTLEVDEATENNFIEE